MFFTAGTLWPCLLFQCPYIMKRRAPKSNKRMLLEPKDLFERLEFDKVLELLTQLCLGELGREVTAAIRPETDLAAIEQKLEEVSEFRRTIDRSDPFPITAYFDIAPDLRMLDIEDYVLSEEAFRRVNIVLLFTRDIFRFFNPERRLLYPALYEIVRPIPFDDGLIKAIEKVIDEDGNIRPDASPELMRIRKNILSKQGELDRVFRRIIQEARNNGWLSDNVESVRNGRRVLSVPSEHKRKIRGIIHDESATGRTAFIEPEPIIEINNDIFDLESEERREIYRILKELSATLRPYSPPMRDYLHLLVRFDVLQAKARLAVQMHGLKPRVADKAQLGFIKSYHPLLLVKNKQLNRKTVPFTLHLHHENRLLLLSGPNAGGKSITMKSVGLMQLMVQCGLLVPAATESEFGIFHKFFADIGDQQSIEDDLSTYSSRLANMRVFLENADRRTLVLIDEFGSGTDPKIGGAIAEAILRELNHRKVAGVITTHYSNLKIFAFKTKGLVNGSMTFDKDSLSPTYELKIGRPGSSYAFEIAQKSGLDAKVLEYARRRVGEQEGAVDQLLIDLQREKQELEEQITQLALKEQKADKLIKSYEQMYRDLEFRKKRLKLETKEQELQQTAQGNRAVEHLIREIREEKNLEKAREMAQKLREERQKLAQQVTVLQEEVYQQPEIKKSPIRKGDFVRLRTGSAIGRVEQVSKQKAVVLMGDMRLTIKLLDLQHSNEPLEINSRASVQTDTIDQSAGFQSKIDIRGMRMDEAMRVVEAFVDQAIMIGANNLRILHGKGDGTLRKAVRMKLREYHFPMDIKHPESSEGGDGVTLVTLA